jgi:gluconokinase
MTDRADPAHPAGPIVVMGVSGSGKSSVGAALAGRLGVPFEDGDDLHPPANVDKMTRGEPLDDRDRWPWLERVGEWLAEHAGGGVIACSALKRRYRDQLRHHCPDVEFLHLEGARDLIERRQASRSGHFMPGSLLTSQFETLEPLAPDERGVVVDVAGSVDEVVARYLGRW